MLRVKLDQDGNGAVTVRLEGRLVGPYAEDTRATLSGFSTLQSIAVDLSEVTFVDAIGEQLLLWLERLGAKVIAVNLYTRGICERLHLKLEEQRPGSSSRSRKDVQAHHDIATD